MGHRRNYDEKKWWEYEETPKQKRRKYVRELASLVSNGSREDTKRVAQELESDEFFERMDKEEAAKRKSKRMSDDELNALVDDLFLLKPKVSE